MSVPAGSWILVTGVSGFLGAHVVHQLLEAGYRVRGTARSTKSAFIQNQYIQWGDKVDITAIDDLVHADYTVALRDVVAVIHVASPLPTHSGTHADHLDASIEGTRTILSQGYQAGVKVFSICSSIFTVTRDYLTFPQTVADKDWNNVTREEAEGPSADALIVYAAQKVLAEQFAWDFADKHPDVEVATFCPGYFIGPFAPEWATQTPGMTALSTNSILYDLVRPSGPVPRSPAAIDVRDVARALILALNAPPTSKVGRKRFPMSGEWYSPRDAVEYLTEVRPDLKPRLSEEAKTAGPARKRTIDTSRVETVLGFQFTDWRKTLLDGVDSILALENDWMNQGWVQPN